MPVKFKFGRHFFDIKFLDERIYFSTYGHWFSMDTFVKIHFFYEQFSTITLY
jgi:hypothetical protein